MKLKLFAFVDDRLAGIFQTWRDMRRWPLCLSCDQRMMPYRPRSMFTCTTCHEGISYEAISDLHKQEMKDRARSGEIRRKNPWRPGERAPSFKSSVNY